ncbi:MAG: hypothetical protein IH977_11200 [Nitrospinae bacterium]|nr:hypothetical protein [Nitrospinota bacterium]
MVKKVYEADPLCRKRCGAWLRIIACIDQPEVIEKIVIHLGLWPSSSPALPLSAGSSWVFPLGSAVAPVKTEVGEEVESKI